MLDKLITVFVCGNEQERIEWADRVANVLEYATVVEGTGVTREWGTEPVLLVQCWYNDDRKWSVYDDLFPVLREYLLEAKQDTGYVTFQCSRHMSGHLLDPLESDSQGAWYELACALVFN